jgi:nicotianamine synthase
MNTQASETIGKIHLAYKQLTNGHALSPRESYAVFRELETLANNDAQIAEQVLSDQSVLNIRGRLRELYEACVYQLEKDWAAQLIDGRLSPAQIAGYSKYERYRVRACLEYFLIATFAGSFPTKLLFVGCGPLPLTAVILAGKFNVSCDFVDKSTEALDLARDVTKSCLPNAQFSHADVLDFTCLSDYDAIIVAGSVCNDEVQKGVLAKHLSNNMSEGQCLVLRLPYLLDNLLVSDVQRSELTNCQSYTAQLVSDGDTICRLIAKKVERNASAARS